MSFPASVKNAGPGGWSPATACGAAAQCASRFYSLNNAQCQRSQSTSPFSMGAESIVEAYKALQKDKLPFQNVRLPNAQQYD
jgi:hypothetical protein